MRDSSHVNPLAVLDALRSRYPGGVPKRFIVARDSQVAPAAGVARLTVLLLEPLTEEGAGLLSAALSKGLGLDMEQVRLIDSSGLSSIDLDVAGEPLLICGEWMRESQASPLLIEVTLHEGKTAGKRFVVHTLHPNRVAKDVSLKRPLWEDLKKFQR